jgi:hypothetical protein
MTGEQIARIIERAASCKLRGVKVREAENGVSVFSAEYEDRAGVDWSLAFGFRPDAKPLTIELAARNAAKSITGEA